MKILVDADACPVVKIVEEEAKKRNIPVYIAIDFKSFYASVECKVRELDPREVTEDRYGRKIPKHAHGSINLGRYSSSTELITAKIMELYDRIDDITSIDTELFREVEF